MHIAICGPDGSGKTTLIEAIREYCSFKGIVVNVSKVEFSAKAVIKNAGLFDKEDDLVKLFVRIGMAFDFANYYKVNQNYNCNALLISDRYDICYRALNRVDNLPGNCIEYLDMIYATVPRADIYIYLKAPVCVLEKRLAQRGNRGNDETSEILDSFSKQYELLLSEYKNVIYVDASESKTQVLNSLISELQSKGVLL